MLEQLAAVILPVVIIAAIGYAWARLKRPFDNALVTQLVSMIATPCLVANALTSLHVEPGSLGKMALATLLVFAGMFVLGFGVLKLMRLPMHSYLPAVVFSNAGNMGLPLALFAFGESGLALAVVYFAFSATLQFTAGVSIAAGTANVRHLARMPVLYAVAGSVAVILTGVEVPGFVANTLDILGGLTIPLMLLALGVSLASLSVRSLPRNLFLSLVRMIGGFAISFLVAWALDLPPMARGVLLIQASMPVAVFNYLFAQYYQRRPEDVAAMVIISTLLSFGTLPFLIYYVLATAG
jgi:malate permease and related proteins